MSIFSHEIVDRRSNQDDWIEKADGLRDQPLLLHSELVTGLPPSTFSDPFYKSVEECQMDIFRSFGGDSSSHPYLIIASRFAFCASCLAGWLKS